MSAGTATLIAGGLAILGTLLGLVVERLMRLVGRLRCDTSGWELEFGTGRFVAWGEDKVGTVTYRFSVDVYNGKEVPTGLRNISVVLVREAGAPLISKPRDSASIGTDIGKSVMFYNPVDVINIPPRQFVHIDLRGTFDREGEEAFASGRWTRVEFVGERPGPVFLGRKTLKTMITEQTLDERGEVSAEPVVGEAGGTQKQAQATPAAERKAEELGVDLSRVEGTGAGGRITVRDVLNAATGSPEAETPAEPRPWWRRVFGG